MNAIVIGHRDSAALRRYALTVGSTAVGCVAVGSVAVAVRRSELPAMVATHWGPSGVNGIQSTPALVATVGAFILVLAYLLGRLATRGPGPTRRILAAATGFAAGLVGVFGYGSVLAQAGLTDPRLARFPTSVAIAAAVVALLAAAVLWWLNPAQVGSQREAELSSDADTLPVAPSEEVVWIGRATASPPVTAALVAVLLVGVGAAWAASPWAALGPLAAGALGLAMLHARVVIDADGVRVSSAGIAWMRVPLAEIQAATYREISPLRDFGGFGMRYRRGQRAYVTRAGDALELRKADGTIAFVTLDRAGQAAAVVNALVRRRGR